MNSLLVFNSKSSTFAEDVQSSYVVSLEGTKLPDGVVGKAPDGELYERNTDASPKPEAASGSESTSEEVDTPAANE